MARLEAPPEELIRTIGILHDNMVATYQHGSVHELPTTRATTSVWWSVELHTDHHLTIQESHDSYNSLDAPFSAKAAHGQQNTVSLFLELPSKHEGSFNLIVDEGYELYFIRNTSLQPERSLSVNGLYRLLDVNGPQGLLNQIYELTGSEKAVKTEIYRDVYFQPLRSAGRPYLSAAESIVGSKITKQQATFNWPNRKKDGDRLYLNASVKLSGSDPHEYQFTYTDIEDGAWNHSLTSANLESLGNLAISELEAYREAGLQLLARNKQRSTGRRPKGRK